VFNQGISVPLIPDTTELPQYTGVMNRIENVTGRTYRPSMLSDRGLGNDAYEATQNLFIGPDPKAVIYTPVSDIANDRKAAYLVRFSNADGLSTAWMKT
jgi:hypothetical protein